MIRVFEPLIKLKIDKSYHLSIKWIFLLKEFVSLWLIFDLQSLQIYSLTSL